MVKRENFWKLLTCIEHITKHLKEHQKTLSFKCSRCDKVYQTPRQLLRHERQKHKVFAEPYKPEVDQIQNSSKPKFVFHIQIWYSLAYNFQSFSIIFEAFLLFRSVKIKIKYILLLKKFCLFQGWPIFTSFCHFQPKNESNFNIKLKSYQRLLLRFTDLFFLSFLTF